MSDIQTAMFPDQPLAPTRAADPSNPQIDLVSSLAENNDGRPEVGVHLQVDPSRCRVFPGNGRADTQFDAVRDRDLCDSIARHGQQTPVLLR